MKTTLQIISGNDFLQEIKETVESSNFLHLLKARGLDSIELDTQSTCQILEIGESSLYKYAHDGKVDRLNIRRILPRVDGMNKPRYRLIDVLLFKSFF